MMRDVGVWAREKEVMCELLRLQLDFKEGFFIQDEEQEQTVTGMPFSSVCLRLLVKFSRQKA